MSKINRPFESASSLKLLACPQAYWDKYVNQNPAWEESGDAARAGKGMHLTLEKALIDYRFTGEIVIDAEQAAMDMFSESTSPVENASIIEATQRNAERIIRQVFPDPALIEGIEEEVVCEALGIGAIIDAYAIDGDTAYVLDHKSSRAVPSEEELSDSYQTFTNVACIFETKPQINTVKMNYAFYRWNCVRTISINREYYESVIKPILRASVLIARDLHELEEPPFPKACGNCSYCPLLSGCSEAHKDAETPEQLAVAALVLAEKAKSAKATLKKIVESLPSPKVHGENFWTMKATTSYSCKNVLGLLQRVVDLNLPVEDYFQVGKAGCEKALEHPELSSFVQIKRGSTFDLEEYRVKEIAQTLAQEKAVEPINEPIKPVVQTPDTAYYSTNTAGQAAINIAVYSDNKLTKDQAEAIIKDQGENVAREMAGLPPVTNPVAPIPEPKSAPVVAPAPSLSFRICEDCHRALTRRDWEKQQIAAGMSEAAVKAAQRVHACDCEKPLGAKVTRQAMDAMQVDSDEFQRWLSETFGAKHPTNGDVRRHIVRQL